MNTIEFNNVWKKFRKGEKFNSLRDAIPNFFRSISKSDKAKLLNKEEFWAVENVSFSVKKGEVVGIIGPNGAGKSTILKLLSGIMNPTKGGIIIRGRLSALIEVTAGFHPDLTGRENIYLNGTILGMSMKDIDSCFEEIIEFSGIRDFIDTPIKRYSSGMLSRLGFSVAAHMNPDILLVDEVLSVGDMAFQAKCAQKMRELLKGGTTIILVSHNLSLVQSLCKRIILLDKGKLQRESTPENVIPYYKEIVFKSSEREIKSNLDKSEYKVKLNEDRAIVIEQSFLCDEEYVKKESFNSGDTISLELVYNARKKIENPIFTLEIIRSDGVSCCMANSKNDYLSIGSLSGQGKIRVKLPELNLNPGIYFTKFIIWDKDSLYPLGRRKGDIIRIEAPGDSIHSDSIFSKKADWDIV